MPVGFPTSNAARDALSNERSSRFPFLEGRWPSLIGRDNVWGPHLGRKTGTYRGTQRATYYVVLHSRRRGARASKVEPQWRHGPGLSSRLWPNAKEAGGCETCKHDTLNQNLTCLPASETSANTASRHRDIENGWFSCQG